MPPLDEKWRLRDDALVDGGVLYDGIDRLPVGGEFRYGFTGSQHTIGQAIVSRTTKPDKATGGLKGLIDRLCRSGADDPHTRRMDVFFCEQETTTRRGSVNR